MADPDDPAEAAIRLEQALERIATLAARATQLRPPQPLAMVAESGEATELADRLDALIARLRSALAEDTGA